MRLELRGAPRRRCHLLLLLVVLVTENALGTVAVALHRRDKSDASDPSREEFYLIQDSGHYGKKCPAGTYVAESYSNGSSKCSSCKENEYTEYPNDFPKCLGCRTCREDQVELSPCRATRDTQCICRNGTFCSPDHPCEMCQKCRPRCLKDEVELAPCMPHSDRRCGPYTGTFSDSSYLLIIAITVPVALLVILIILCGWCCCRHRSSGDRRDVSGKPCSMMAYMLPWLTRCPSGGLGTQDNIHNEQVSQLLPGLPASVTSSAPRQEVMAPRPLDTSMKPRRRLVPTEGNKACDALRSSFTIFAQEVPWKDWKRFGRGLGLLENDIAHAEKYDKYPQEPIYQVLHMWQNREGLNASVNTLLETLHQIRLGGIAEDISSKLVQHGSFQYETS